MAKSKSTNFIWRQIESGLSVPDGRVTNYAQSSSKSYLDIKNGAMQLVHLYRENRVPLPGSCDLAKLIGNAIAVSDEWLAGDANKISITNLIQLCHFDRIISAILPLRQEPSRVQFLLKLGSGNLDLLKRTKSASKDWLWEIELLSMLKMRSLKATLEEPDIVVDFDTTKIGISCKKLYSENHVQNVLSKAVSQIEGSFDFGIVAINIDDLFPADKKIMAESQAALSRRISQFNEQFLRPHERHFRKYLSSGRIISALISTSVLGQVRLPHAKLFNARQSLVWTIPGLPPEKDRALRRFYTQFMS